MAGGSLLFAFVMGCSSDSSGEGTGTGGSAVGGTGGTIGTAGTVTGTGGTAGTSDTTSIKARVCQCWFDLQNIHLERLNPQCEAQITDECISCTEAITGGAPCVGMDKTQLQDCVDKCLHLVPSPTTAQECKELTRAGTTVPQAIASGDCMCDNCFDLYAPCIANTACLSVMLCVAETGCIGANCLSDPVCAPIVTDALTADQTLMEPLSTTIANCSAENSCQ